jgi:hypothetical protein
MFKIEVDVKHSYNFNLVRAVVMIVIKRKEDVVYHNKGLLITHMGDLYITCFISQGSYSGNTYIKVTKKSSWFKSGLNINEISFLKLIGLYWRVIGVCVDVICIVDFAGKWVNIFLRTVSVWTL